MPKDQFVTTNNAEDNSQSTMTAGRMEAFSDGVIAIIITIMVLELKPPASFEPIALIQEGHIFLAYAMSFTIVSIYWVNHHHLLHTARNICTDTLWLNIHWLFWLSLFPFATAYIGNSQGAPFPIAIYATLSLVVAFSYLLLTLNLTRHNRHITSITASAKKRKMKNTIAIMLVAAAIPLAWISKPIAIILLIAPAIAYFLDV